MFRSIKLLALAGLFLATHANAALITLETASVDGSFNESDLAGYFSTVESTTTTELDNFTMVNLADNKIHKLTIEFDQNFDSMVDMFFGLDAGHGAEVFVNGTNVFDTESNLWWSFNWQNASVISLQDVALATGLNTIELYFAEDCCSGASSIEFNDGRGLQALTVANIQAAEVPAPATLGLFGLVLAGAVLRRRTR